MTITSLQVVPELPVRNSQPDMQSLEPVSILSISTIRDFERANWPSFDIRKCSNSLTVPARRAGSSQARMGTSADLHSTENQVGRSSAAPAARIMLKRNRPLATRFELLGKHLHWTPYPSRCHHTTNIQKEKGLLRHLHSSSEERIEAVAGFTLISSRSMETNHSCEN